MTVRFIPNDTNNPATKLADAELRFDDGPLAGLKLVGFAVWQRKTGGLNVTVPARQYLVSGERRAYALLRPMDGPEAQDRLRDVIIDAWKTFQAEMEGGHVELTDEDGGDE